MLVLALVENIQREEPERDRGSGGVPAADRRLRIHAEGSRRATRAGPLHDLQRPAASRLAPARPGARRAGTASPPAMRGRCCRCPMRARRSASPGRSSTATCRCVRRSVAPGRSATVERRAASRAGAARGSAGRRSRRAARGDPARPQPRYRGRDPPERQGEWRDPHSLPRRRRFRADPPPAPGRRRAGTVRGRLTACPSGDGRSRDRDGDVAARRFHVSARRRSGSVALGWPRSAFWFGLRTGRRGRMPGSPKLRPGRTR